MGKQKPAMSVEERRAAALASLERSSLLESMADAVARSPEQALTNAINGLSNSLGSVDPAHAPTVAAWVEAALAAGADPLGKPLGASLTFLEVAIQRGERASTLALAKAASQRIASGEASAEAAVLATVERGQREAFEVIFSAIPEGEAKAKLASRALLWCKAKTGREIVTALFDAGADPRAKNAKGNSAISVAAAAGAAEMVSRLLAMGVDPDTRSRDGATPLMAAVESAGQAPGARQEVVAVLLAAGADPDAMDQRGRSVAEAARPREAWLIDALARAREERELRAQTPEAKAPGAGPSRL